MLVLQRGGAMFDKEYLLDTNIIIKIWNQYPYLFDDMEKNEKVDFKIYHHVASELYIKEVRELDKVPVLTDKFMKLLSHIINENEIQFSEVSKPNVSIRYDLNKYTYYINGNKLSINDFSLISICEGYKQYTLVTEDKKLLNSARIILDSSKVLTYNEFLCDLEKYNVIIN